MDNMAIYKVKKGYRAEVNLGNHPITGNRMRKTKTFRLKGEAQDWERETIQQYKDGNVDFQGDMNLAYFLDHWYNTHVMANTKYNTQKRYKTLKDCVIDHLGHLQLGKVRAPHIDRFYADLQLEKVKLKNGTIKRRYSNGTILKVHRVFRQAMEKAVAWDIIAKNPVQYATPPKDDERNIQTWNIEQTNFFLDKISDTVMYLPCFIVFHTGLRAGEVCALRWEDISFEDSLLYVNNNAVEITGEGVALDDPKTPKSKDYVVMTKGLAEKLKRIKQEQRLHKMANGIKGDFDYVCCWEDGRPIRPNYISTKFKELVEDHDMKTITFHGLRHTHATILYESGVSSHEISKRLRHSRVATTDDIYIHVTEEIKKSTAESFDRAVEKI